MPSWIEGSAAMGWSGHYLLWANGILLVTRRLKPDLGGAASAAVLFGVAAMSLLPVDGVALYGYPAAFLGELSLVSQALLSLLLYRQLTGAAVLPFREKHFLLDAVALAGLLLYVFSSGLSSVDLYSLGFGSRSFLLILAGLSAGLWWFRPLTAAAIPTALIGWQLGVLTSDNLWDYLLDVPLVVYALGSIVLRRRGTIP